MQTKFDQWNFRIPGIYDENDRNFVSNENSKNLLATILFLAGFMPE